MKALGVAIVLILVIVTGIAAVRWFNHALTQSTQPTGLKFRTGVTSTLPEGHASTAIATSVQSVSFDASTTNFAGWAIFTNLEDLFSIEYPTTFGTVYVSYGGATRETILNIGGYEVDISLVDDPEGLTVEQWLDQEASTSDEAPPPMESVTVNGLNAIVVPSPGQDDTVGGYFYAVIGGASAIYELRFSCDGYCLPPPFWRQMFNSFEALPPEQQL
jgi:hypothetical protein